MHENIPTRTFEMYDELQLMEDELYNVGFVDDEFDFNGFIDEQILDIEPTYGEPTNDDGEETDLDVLERMTIEEEDLNEPEQCLEIADNKNTNVDENPAENTSVLRFDLNYCTVFVYNFFTYQKLAVTGGPDWALWNTENNQVSQCISQHKNTSEDFRFRHDGTYVATGSGPGENLVLKVLPTVANPAANHIPLQKMCQYSIYWKYMKNTQISGDAVGDMFEFLISNDDVKLSVDKDQQPVVGATNSDGKKLLLYNTNGIKLLDIETYKVIWIADETNPIRKGIVCHDNNLSHESGKFDGQVIFVVNNGPTDTAQSNEAIERVAFLPSSN